MLTDVVLRDQDGLASLAPVIDKMPHMPVIVMSAQNTLDTAVRASEINALRIFSQAV